jgi:hypothetical protein
MGANTKTIVCKTSMLMKCSESDFHGDYLAEEERLDYSWVFLQEAPLFWELSAVSLAASDNKTPI